MPRWAQAVGEVLPLTHFLRIVRGILLFARKEDPVLTSLSLAAETRAALGLSDTLIRLSPGCESPRDLVKDIVDGLDRVRAVQQVPEEQAV